MLYCDNIRIFYGIPLIDGIDKRTSENALFQNTPFCNRKYGIYKIIRRKQHHYGKRECTPSQPLQKQAFPRCVFAIHFRKKKKLGLMICTLFTGQIKSGKEGTYHSANRAFLFLYNSSKLLFKIISAHFNHNRTTMRAITDFRAVQKLFNKLFKLICRCIISTLYRRTTSRIVKDPIQLFRNRGVT